LDIEVGEWILINVLSVFFSLLHSPHIYVEQPFITPNPRPLHPSSLFSS
jgi:hypothetical protein